MNSALDMQQRHGNTDSNAAREASAPKWRHNFANPRRAMAMAVIRLRDKAHADGPWARK